MALKMEKAFTRNVRNLPLIETDNPAEMAGIRDKTLDPIIFRPIVDLDASIPVGPDRLPVVVEWHRRRRS
jgi:hypothetical protein